MGAHRPPAAVATDAPPAPATGPTSSAAASITIFFRSSWSKVVLHGSVLGGKWADYPLTAHPSGKWHTLTLPLPAAAASQPSAAPLLEFVLTDKQHHWEKGPEGTNLTVTQPGAFTVADSKASPVAGKRVMVVSDLDGTMVGDDKATAAFTQWWHDAAVPRGGVLVYNTGRSLDSFKGLLRDKAKVLAVPDALISAVGTKVYEQDVGKGAPGGEPAWRVDEAWMSTLDEGWDVKVVREACDKALQEAGPERMHYRPPEEQNRHKVTCGVHTAALQRALATLQAHLDAKGVKANVITSGHGDWRYLDVVPIRAGKLAALNYVRGRYGFAPLETVACGDSGNDILMLQGDNPAIIVGNAQPDLREWYQARQGSEPAGGGPEGKARLLLVKQHEALGILEGLQHWGFK